METVQLCCDEKCCCKELSLLEKVAGSAKVFRYFRAALLNLFEIWIFVKRF